MDPKSLSHVAGDDGAPGDSIQADAERFRFLLDRLIAVDWDYQDSGQCVIAFDWPKGGRVSVDVRDTFDSAMDGAKAMKGAA